MDRGGSSWKWPCPQFMVNSRCCEDENGDRVTATATVSTHSQLLDKPVNNHLTHISATACPLVKFRCGGQRRRRRAVMSLLYGQIDCGARPNGVVDGEYKRALVVRVRRVVLVVLTTLRVSSLFSPSTMYNAVSGHACIVQTSASALPLCLISTASAHLHFATHPLIQ